MLKKWINSWLDDAPQNQTAHQQLKLNLKKTLVAHDKMKLTLEQELTDSNNVSPINAVEIGQHDTCDYGKWLISTGKAKYSQTEEYKNAFEAHTFYHQIAADIIYTHQAGNTKKAKRLLKTSFKEASNLNQIECVRLYNLTLK